MQRKAGHGGLTANSATRQKPAKTRLEYDQRAHQFKIRRADAETGREIKTQLAVDTRGGGTQYFIPKSVQSRRGRQLLKASTRVLKYGIRTSGKEQMTIESGGVASSFGLNSSDYRIVPNP